MVIFEKHGTAKRKCTICGMEKVVWIGLIDGKPAQLCPEHLSEGE